MTELWSVGELAAACGVTVRTLHHYDRLGLAPASARTTAGHRRYSESDVARLYEVLALRRLGLGLEAIRDWLESDADLAAAIRAHLVSVDTQIERQQQLRARLSRLLATVERTGRPIAAELLPVMEAMDMYEEHLTPEQSARLDEQRGELGFPGHDQWRADAEQAISELRSAYESGVEPTDPSVWEIAQRIVLLRRQFTGADADIGQALRGAHSDAAWSELRAVIPSDPQLRAYFRAAKNAP